MDAAERRNALLEHFREQTHFGDTYGSPFSARLAECMAQDFEAGGPVADLLGERTGNPRADAVAVRLAGALHAAVLTGRDPALAAQYPEQRRDWDINVLWPLARNFLVREQTWVAGFVRSAPQTNEVRRSIALLLGFLLLAQEHDCSMDMFELGASAGLNLNWDRFRYQTASWSWGNPDGVAIDTLWEGPAPPQSVIPQVRSRAACDLNPLDVRDPAQRLKLRSYIWADQPQRLARFDAAAELAVATGVQVERADAGDWLRRKLAERAPGAGTIVYHSVFLQYLGRETRVAIKAAIEAAGELATPDAPFAWLRLEPEVLLGGARDSTRIMLDMVTWPGGLRRQLALTDGHVNQVQALHQDSETV